MAADTFIAPAIPLPVHIHEELFHLATDLFVILDNGGRIVRTNAPFTRLIGCSLPELAGQSLAHFTHTDDQSRLSALLNNLDSKHMSEQLDLNFLVKEQGAVRCNFTFNLSGNGHYILAIGWCYKKRAQYCDSVCKEQLELEQLVNEKTRGLQLANVEMQSFGRSISHNLRAPLRVIRGFANAIAEDYGDYLGTTGNDYVQRILSNCERITKLTEYLLQQAQMSGKELCRTRVDLGHIADTIIADMKMVEPYRDVSFSRHGHMMVEGDRELLFTLLQSLLSNAWKYTSTCPDAHIRFSSEEVDGETVFSVVDNGRGYPVAMQERLFSLSRRLHNSNEYEGLGGGLPTAQRIVQRHGGRIWAECIEGERTSFFFTLTGH